MQDPDKKSLPTQTNQSSDRLLTIIEVMAESEGPMRLQDVAKAAGTNPPTCLRFVTALQRRNYVAQEIDTGRYYLTFKFRAIAESISAYTDIRTIAAPFLRSTARLFNESCNLAVENSMSIMYIEVANSPNQTLFSTQRIGNVAPMHCTGIGKLILAGYTPGELDRFLAVKGLPALTDYTLTTEEALAAELGKIRGLGYAFDNQECEVGVRCISAPIRDYTGRTVAGISLSGPTVRMTDGRIYENLPYLLDTAKQISVRMGGGETPRPNGSEAPRPDGGEAPRPDAPLA